MVVARKIAYNIVFNSAVKVITTVALSLVSIRLITEHLGKEGFGDYATVLAFFGLFAALADLGIGSITAREISRDGADESAILGKVASLRLLTSTGLFLISPIIIWFFGYPTEVKIGIWIASGAVIFSSFSIFLNGIFQKNIAMDRVAMIEFFGKLIQVGCVALVVAFDLGFLAVTSTLLASLSFNAVIAFLFSRKYARFSFHVDTAFWKDFLRHSLPLGGSVIVTFLYFKTDTIILSLMQGSAAVGTYGVAYKVMENLTFFPAMLAGLILPIVSRYILSDREQFRHIADATFRVFLIIALPIVIGGIFFSGDVIGIVSGEGFEESVFVLEMLLGSLGFIFFGHFFNMILIAGNLQRKLMKATMFIAGFNIVTNLVLIPRFSYLGAASTSLLTEVAVAIVTGTLVFRHLAYRPSFRLVGRVFLAAALMALFLYSVSLPFVLEGFLSVAVYLAALWFLKAVSSREVGELFSKKSEKEAVPVREVM